MNPNFSDGLLDNFTFKLLIDTDPGLGTNYTTLTLEPEAPIQSPDGFGTPLHNSSDHQWRVGMTVPIHDDEGTADRKSTRLNSSH